MNHLLPCYNDIQQTLSTAASGMEQMGQAWAALAAQKSSIMDEPEANKKKDEDEPRAKKLKLDILDNESVLDFEDDELTSLIIFGM